VAFTDNFGIFIRATFPAFNKLDEFTDGMIDISGTPRNIKIKGLSNSNTFNRSVANFAQIGKGSTPPQKSDINIENPFTNGGIEDNQFAVPNGGFALNTNRILFATQLNPTGGSGGIREVCYFLRFRVSDGSDQLFLIFRDVIPLVSFVAGQSLTIEQEVFF